MIFFLYNFIFPLAFLFFIPGMIIKYIRRGGEKDNYLERFAIFSKEKKEMLRTSQGGIWVHSVSVGESVIAVDMIKKWLIKNPSQKFILSTTTTTGQALAKSRVPDGVIVIFCPIDFIFFVKKTFKLISPKLLIIFETEIWPNMICEARKFGAETALVNARISDKSANGYRRASLFFGPVLRQFSQICVQTELDGDRFKAVESELNIVIAGNMKFDQGVPADFADLNLSNYFGKGEFSILLAASTHPGEEVLLGECYKELLNKYKNLKLIIIPRHAERGDEIALKLKNMGIKVTQRSKDGDRSDKSDEFCELLLADTTGEMLAFMNLADIVVMGKSLAGHNEGHNIIEPALLGKPVITGCELRNFRYTLKAMRDDDAIITVESDSELVTKISCLLDNPSECKALGKRAKYAIEKHKGATEKTIELCKKLLK